MTQTNPTPIVSDSASRARTTDTDYQEPTQWEVAECDRLDLLAREGYDAQNQPTFANGMTLRDAWDMAGRRVLGDHWDFDEPTEADGTPSGIKHFTINQVLPLILTHAAAQTEQDPTIKLTAVQIAEDPLAVYLKHKAGRKISRMMLAGDARISGFTTNQLAGDEPVTIDQYEVLTLPNPTTPAVKPLLQTDDFWLIDDKTIAQAGQTLFDLYWDRCAGNLSFMEHVFLCAVFGHQPWLLETKSEPFGFILSCPHVSNVYVDSNRTKIEDMENVVYDQLMSADAAKMEYPRFAPDIDRISAVGSIANSTGVRMGSQFTRTNWQRRMLLVRTVWERNYPFPLTPEQAIAAGKVTPFNPTQPGDPSHDPSTYHPSGTILVPWQADEALAHGIIEPDTELNAGMPDPEPDGADDATETAPAPPLSGTVLDPTGAPAEPQGGGPPQPTKATHRLVDTGEPVFEGHPHWPAMHAMPSGQTLQIPDQNNPPAYFLPNGEPVSPTDEAWPQRFGLRQVVVLSDAHRILSDGECDYSDIPMAWTKNIPIQYQPYGQGSPVTLDNIQQFVNRLATNLYNIVRWNAYPPEYMPESLKTALEAAGQHPGARPNETIGIPDEVYNRWFVEGNRQGFHVPPPPIPEYAIRLLSQFMETFDHLGGNVGVLQGLPPGAADSGVALAQLTANAKGPLGFKSKFAEDSLTRMGRLMFDAILKFCPDEEMGKYFRQYPPHVWAVLRDALRTSDWDVKVELVSGKGANKAQTRAQTLEENKAGLLTKRTAREKLGIDADLEERREEEEAEEAANEQMRLSMMQAPPGAAPGMPGAPPTAPPAQQQGGMPLPPEAAA